MKRKVDLGETRGIVRKLDELGRITLPKEFRETINLKEGDKAEIFLVQNGFFIRKV